MIKFLTVTLLVTFLSIFQSACSTPEKKLPSCQEIAEPILNSYQQQKAQYLGPISENGIHAEVFDAGEYGLAMLFGEDAAMTQVQFPAHVTVEASGRCVVPNMSPLQYRAIKMKKPVEKERTL